MIVDRHIIDLFLNNVSIEEEWIFKEFEDSVKHFEQPDLLLKEQIERDLQTILCFLNEFELRNVELIAELFPEYKEYLCDMQIILTVGYPEPYDARCLEHDGRQYLVFDLVRIHKYLEHNSIEDIMNNFITHEFVHLFIHKKYSNCFSNYQARLKYLVFDEGFAHYLSFKQNSIEYNFCTEIEKYYKNAKKQFVQALSEEVCEKQKEYLEIANTGTGGFWEKFASVSGMLFLAQNPQRIKELFALGPEKFSEELLNRIDRI